MKDTNANNKNNTIVSKMLSYTWLTPFIMPVTKTEQYPFIVLVVLMFIIVLIGYALMFKK